MSRRSNLAWSVRRELWENRALLVTPLVVAALALTGFLFHAGKFAEGVRMLAALDPAKQLNAAVIPFGMVAAAILFFSWVAGVFYCLDALGTERRDRSILFWKSMPVSDAMSVAAKVIVPLAIVPIYACAVVLATQAVMLAGITAVLGSRGIDPDLLWSRLPLWTMPVAMLYGMAAHALWFAPAFGWFLLVSAWAKRAAFLWAFLPFFGAFAFEKIAFGTGHVGAFLKSRLIATPAFKANVFKDPITQLSQLDPAGFLASPGLWLGLIAAGILIAAAIQLRRYRGPL